MLKECKKHGETDHFNVAKGNGYYSYRCRKCNAESSVRSRQRQKQRLVEEHGGQCVRCGYDKCIGALHFHHRDPTQKEFNVSLGGLCRSLDALRVEAAKCDLVCANCHAEIEAGLVNA